MLISSRKKVLLLATAHVHSCIFRLYIMDSNLCLEANTHFPSELQDTHK